jgi:hypothetical protein
MPITVERDLAQQWLVATASGDIASAELLELLRTARAPMELRMWPLVFDGTGATTSMVERDVESLVEFVRAAAAAGQRRGHVALVADDDRFYRLLLTYESRCAAIGVRLIRVFRYRPEAERWLKVMSAARHLQ